MSFGWGHLTGAALFGLLLDKMITHFLAKRHSKQERQIVRHNERVSQFKSAFSDALLNVSIGEHTVALILRQTYRSHEVAYHLFRKHMSKNKKGKFDEAWANYEAYYEANAKEAMHYQFASAKTGFEAEQRKIVTSLLKELLDFAEEE